MANKQVLKIMFLWPGGPIKMKSARGRGASLEGHGGGRDVCEVRAPGSAMHSHTSWLGLQLQVSFQRNKAVSLL